MKKQFLFTSFLFILVFMFSCKEQIIEMQTEDKQVQSLYYSNTRESAGKPDDPMILGKKLQNPYLVENMKIAYNNLKNNNKDFPNLSIKANYKYIRFLPKTDEEYDLLTNDDNMDLFGYPLDVEISKNGNLYKDPSTKNNKFTWYYTTVPSDYTTPKKIQTENLADLYLPKGNGNAKSPEKLNKTSSNIDDTFLNDLENEALRITGNLKYNKNGKISSYIPRGTIRVWDERMNYNFNTGTYQNGQGYVPVPGCKVRTRRWFSTETAITELDGSYDIGVSYNHDANYSIEWDRADFDIRDGSYGQAYFNGPKQSGNWDLDIEGNGDSFIYAHVHRAAWNYYYNNTFGVNVPPTKTFFDFYGAANLVGQKMHLGATRGGGRSHYFEFNGNWLASQIKLIFDFSNPLHDGRYIFATTIHELTHASHWVMGMTYTEYCTNSGQAGRLAESWAQAVGWHITRLIYQVTNPTNAPFENVDHTQLMSIADMSGGSCASNNEWYTPLFIDLNDEFNQVGQQFGRPNDEASLYTFPEMQSFLMARPTNWYMYRDYLENNSNNGSEAAALQLFSDYD